MTHPSIVTYFDEWLFQNRDSFMYKPISISPNKYKFEGINDNIILVIDDTNCEVLIEFSKDSIKYDSLSLAYLDNIIYVTDKGYTDTSWIGDYKKRYYLTYKDILIDNLFNPIIRYVNDKFVSSNYLHFVNINTDGITFALITDILEEKELIKLQTAYRKIDKTVHQDADVKLSIFKCSIFDMN